MPAKICQICETRPTRDGEDICAYCRARMAAGPGINAAAAITAESFHKCRQCGAECCACDICREAKGGRGDICAKCHRKESATK